MEHITLFFCDIRNTFLGKCVNDESDIKDFIINLERIRKKNKSENLLFIFASEEIPDEIERVQEHFSSYIDSSSSIKIIKNLNHDNMKTINIIYMIKKMCRKYFIDEIYFADDCKIYHEIVRELLFENGVDVKINSIITTTGGVIEINRILEDVSKIKVKSR